MLSKEIKKRIDNARDTLVGVLPLPTDQIELITIALIYKFMDDQDEELRQVGFDEKFFKGDLKEYSWQRLMSNQISANQRVTKFIHGIDQIQKAKDIPELFKEIFQNAFLKFRDGKVLQRFLDIINGFNYSHSEELGNAFEYLLMTMGAQGDNGQFRTPRNIIDFMVDIVNPLKTDTILDPACGTGGFLVAAFKHILRTNTKGYENSRITANGINEEKLFAILGEKLTTVERSAIEKNISGYDNTPLMVRLARVNLYLHHFNNPKIHEYNTLNNDSRWKERFDCILANPPFMTPKGGIDPHDKFRIQANRTEILFSSYILQHLNSENGKAGFIVPEGVIFASSGDYIALRKWLLYEAGLWAVVSLPAGVFQPYSGVKTSILLIDKEISRNRKEVLLVKINTDGFSLNTSRNPIKFNDLPDALRWLQLCKTDKKGLIRLLESKKEIKLTEQVHFLNRQEFAKIDAYKSSNSVLSFISKLYEQTIGFKTNTEALIDLEKNKLKKLKKFSQKRESVENIIDKLNEKVSKRIEDFCKIVHIDFLPENFEALKLWFNENMKEYAIEYGLTLQSKELPEKLKLYLDNQREFSLSFEKYTNKHFFNEEIEYVRIEEVCNVFADGDWIERKDQSEYGIRLIQTGNIGCGIFRNKNAEKARYISEETFDRLKCTEVFSDDILISRLPDPVGRACKVPVLKERLITAVDCTILRFNEFQILPDYFICLTFSDEYYKRINQNLTGASRQRISRKNLGNVLIPKPSLDIQQKIVAEIGQYQKVMYGCDLLIENYRPNFDIKEDWDFIELEKVCKIYGGGTPSKDNPTFWENGTIKWLSAKYIDNDGRITGYDLITKSAFESSSSKIARKGSTILVSRVSVGKTAFADSDYAINQDLTALVANKSKINEVYLFLVSRFLAIEVEKNAQGIGVRGVTRDFIAKYLIPLPSISEQNEIVNEYLREQETIIGARDLKRKMQQKIKEVIDKVWGK